MKDQNCTENIQTILEESPAARKALLDNYENLHKVAEYCERNYYQAEGTDLKKALDETKAFTTQSLASMAYQISTLATNVLKLLDTQTIQLGQMESSINLIAQTVDMHREKVARREIGVFTTVKKVPRNQKVIPPAAREPHPKYSRTPINYSALDTVGHGMKDSGTQLSRTGTMNRKQSTRDAGGTLGRTARAPEPVQCPVAPSMSKGPSMSSLSDRSLGSSFGIAVPPPMVPDLSVPDFTVPPLEDTTPPFLADTDVLPPPPPSAPSMDGAPPPPAPPPPPCAPGLSIPPPPPPLETVAEENGFPLLLDSLPTPDNSAFELPVPPSFQSEDLSSALRPKRSRVLRHPPTSRSGSLRGRLAPSTRALRTLSLALPSSHPLIIPPPPPYPPPLAPLALLSPLYGLSDRLQHLDLDFQVPPPPPDNIMMENYDDIMPPLPPPVDYDQSAPANYLEKVVALYSYSSDKPGDLSFDEGAIIYLTKRNNDGWCEGVLNGVEGFFPGNYVEPTS
ncbi:ABI gene family member 3-like isoform X2 [Arapaima gigas]